MSTFRNPVGPQPSTVYWRRRLLVILGLLAVIVAIVLIIVGPGLAGQGGRKDAVAPNPSGAASNPAEKPFENADPSKECKTSAVKVEAVTDKDSYKADEKPMISLNLTNSGASACTFKAGADVQVYTITSGSDIIWTSTDCQSAAEPTSTVLEPGKAVSTTPFAWDRTRSSKTTCEGDRPAVTGGGATYRLAVTVNDVEAAAPKPFLLY